MPRFPNSAASAGGVSDRVFGAPALRPPPGKAFFALNVGDTYLEPLAAARAEAQRAADHPRLHNYAPVQGEPALLDAILEKLERRSGVRPARDNVQVMSGATAGLAVVATALLEPGDEVLLPAPFWPLIRGIVALRGARPVEVPFYTRLDDPSFDPVAALEAAITPRTVAIYLNSPHNPTGATLPEAAVVQIAALARRHDLWVLCDEVYEDLWFGEQAPRSIWAREDLRERAIATHSVSKAYGLAGARVGFTHGPAAIMQTIRGVQTFFTYCAPRPLQLGAARALAEGDAWLADARARYKRAASTACEALGLPLPAGGTFLFFDAAPYLRPGETLDGLLQRCADAGVMLTPGSASGRDFAGWLRLCFTCVPLRELEQALAQLEPVLTARRNR